MLEVGVLGPLEVLVDGSPLSLGGPKQQVVFATLATQPGKVVSLDTLIDEVWPQRPPASAVANARGYAANLRRLLDAALPGRGLLARHGFGYRLLVRPDEVDLVGFTTECEQARRATTSGDRTAASMLFARAEARWRGAMLAGLPLGPALEARRAAVEEERLVVVEERAELYLSLEQPQMAVTLLRDHLQAHPLRERAHILLMRARYEVGDVAGALSVYATARSALVDQLGVEPGAQLRRLHQAVLNRDPVPELIGQANAARAAIAMAVPRQKPRVETVTVRSGETTGPTRWLPRTVADFTGRQEAVARLVAAVEHVDPAAAVVQVIDGMAGIGKTTLAVHVADRLAARYPDGQLFIDLRGHSDGSPVGPATALVTLLRQIGVPASRIPPELDHRIALWRTELAARHVIVVLDNAASSEQIDPLLPASPGSLTLVTSRRRLAAFDGTPPQSLPVLPEEEAVELLAKVAGPARVRAEPESAAEVVRRCGCLPLAIRLAGARLAHRPGWRVADLARRLGQDSPVLAELTAEDRTVAGAFALSYEQLRDPAKQMFRLLGLYPGEFFGAVVAAALSDLPLLEAETVVAELVDRHLVEETAAGRFRLHDLMREYAHSLAVAVDPPAGREAAIGRVLDHYLHVTAMVTEPLEWATIRKHLVLREPMRPDLLAALGGVDVDWLEARRANLTALIRLATESGFDGAAWQLTRATWRFYYLRGYWDDIFDTHGHGLRAAQRLNDEAAVAAMHNYLASAYLRTAQYQRAFESLEVAINLRERSGDKIGANVSRVNLAIVYCLLGRLEESVELTERALEERRRWGGEAEAIWPNLGIVLTILGRYDEALHLHRLELFAALRRDQFHVANALGHIGSVRIRLGHYRQAVRLIRASLRLRVRTGNRFAASEALNDLGVAYRHLGRLDEAYRQHRAALEAALASGERHVESAALNNLGLTLAASDRHAEAMEKHRQALALATRISHPYEQGRALTGLAACVAPDDPAEARRHLERALAIFRKMGVPERFEVERQLVGLREEPCGHPHPVADLSSTYRSKL